MKDNEIDLTVPQREFRVPTTVKRNGVAYMGPEVRINAHNAEDAIRRIEQAGHTYNNNFRPDEVEKRR